MALTIPNSTLTPSRGKLVACHECDLLHHYEPPPRGGKALCARCGGLLYRHVPNSLERVLALNLASLMLFAMAHCFPFLSLKLGGRVEENVLLSGAWALVKQGMWEVGAVVFLTSAVFPLLTIAGMLYVLIPLRFGARAPGAGRVYRAVRTLWPWSLLGVFMLGVLVSMVKLLDLAAVIPGISLFAFIALLIVSTAARSNLDDSIVWPMENEPEHARGDGITAEDQGMLSCHGCGLLLGLRALVPHAHCPRCAAPLHRRKPNSVARTWALLAASAILLVPANVYPVMTVIQLGRGEPNTIIGGITHLIEGGMWGLAMLVLFASVVVPLLKLVVLSTLLVTVQRGSSWRPRDRTRLFRLIEVVGAWSMVDVYLVGILIALVNMGALASVQAGVGVAFFAAVVVLTMFAAHSFDPRLIWDNAGITNDNE